MPTIVYANFPADCTLQRLLYTRARNAPKSCQPPSAEQHRRDIFFSERNWRENSTFIHVLTGTRTNASIVLTQEKEAGALNARAEREREREREEKRREEKRR